MLSIKVKLKVEMVVLDGCDFGTLVCLSVDALVAYVFYRYYKSCTKSSLEIKDIRSVEIGPELIRELSTLPNHSLPYVCVQGTATTQGVTLVSQYGKQEGIIQNISYVEHKSKRYNGVWSDATNVIRNIWEAVPLYLQSHVQDGPQILVTEPRSALYLEDDLITTHDKFEPNQSNIFHRGIDRISGEVTKGFQETERMLLKGASLIGMGKVALENGVVKLLQPTEGQTYILSTRSKEEILTNFLFKSKTFKLWSYILGGVGLALSIFLVTRLVWKLRVYIRNRRMVKALRRSQQQREADRAVRARDVQEAEGADNSCVVCLSNPREVVLLECAHICVCADCVIALPEPKKCPVCRQPVQRFIATYSP